MRQLPWEQRTTLKRLLAAGVSHRTICATVPCGKATVVRYARMWKMAATCGCGQPAGHRGWCHVRLDFSPQRRGWLADHWGARAKSEVAVAVDRAYHEAKAYRHRLGAFVYGSAATSSLAYSLCGICGKMARIRNDNTIDGTAIRQPCFTQAERAAMKAAHQEKREWRKAKRTLLEIRNSLRPPGLRTQVSPQAPNSRG